MDARIIPARAGFTAPPRCRGPAPRDHPRSRGVYTTSSSSRQSTGGSSPLARGLRRELEEDGYRARIIPARAGFTRGPVRRRAARQDHPRSRGVYCGRSTPSPRTDGSSPLARGLLPGLLSAALAGGIIPARAGFTRRPRGRCGRRRDHPRSRGVYVTSAHVRRAPTGSSPLARGLRGGVERGPPRQGIIPARAGFTVTGGGRGRDDADHPRSRGVYEDLPLDTVVQWGSSPLARGLQASRLRGLIVGRIIPARAGFTKYTAG